MGATLVDLKVVCVLCLPIMIMVGLLHCCLGLTVISGLPLEILYKLFGFVACLVHAMMDYGCQHRGVCLCV